MTESTPTRHHSTVHPSTPMDFTHVKQSVIEDSSNTRQTDFVILIPLQSDMPHHQELFFSARPYISQSRTNSCVTIVKFITGLHAFTMIITNTCTIRQGQQPTRSTLHRSYNNHRHIQFGLKVWEFCNSLGMEVPKWN